MDWTRRDIGRLGLGAGAFGFLAGIPGLGTSPARATGVASEAGGPSHGVSAFGDLKYPSDFAHFDYADPSAPVGGTFSTGYGGVTFDSLHPFILKGNPAIGLTLTVDTLMTGADDEPDSMYGLLAESIELGPGRKWAEFRLREEARFSDGTPVTAEDVVFTYNILMEKGHPSYRFAYAAVTGVEATGPLSVRFTFDETFALRDMPMAVAGLPVLSRAFWDGRDFAESTLDAPVASGPFIVENAEPGRKIVYKRREDYWGWHLPVNKGRWNFERIRFEYFRDRSAAFEAFKAGKFTFQEEFWSKLWATAYKFPAIERGDVVRKSIPDNRPAGTQGYWFNLRRDKFADPRVREAIATVFDFEWSNKTLFFDLYTRTDSFFEGGPMQAAGAPTPGELELLEPMKDELPPGTLGEAWVPPVTDGSGRNRAELRRAAQLLDEAGWKVVDGVRQNDAGEPLSIEFLLVGEGFERITVPYMRNLERIGVQGTVRTIDPAQYKNRMDSFDFDVTVDRKAMSLTPGVELRDYFHSTSANSPGAENTAGVAHPAVDRLIDIIERAGTREELTNAVKALDRVLRALHIWVPQWSKGSHTIAYWDIFGHPDLKPEYARGVIDLWWIDQEKYARLADTVGG